MKRIQRWSRQNWLGGILIIVSLHIHFNKLIMPIFTHMLRCQLGAKFTVFYLCLLFSNLKPR